MAGLGTMELCVIAVIALFVIGPDRLPEFARIVMRVWRDLRRYSDEIRSEIQTPLFDLKNTIRDARREILNPSSGEHRSPHQLTEPVSGDDYDPYEDAEYEVEDIEAEYEDIDDSVDIEEDIAASAVDESEEDENSKESPPE